VKLLFVKLNFHFGCKNENSLKGEIEGQDTDSKGSARQQEISFPLLVSTNMKSRTVAIGKVMNFCV